MELEELIKHYFNSIDHFKNDEGIASILPGPEHSDYDELMQGLMAKFKEQMEELVLYAQTNDVDNDELIDMLMEIRIKQEAVKKKYTEDKILIEEATKEVQEENEVLDSSRRVIFARGEGDTVLVERYCLNFKN